MLNCSCAFLFTTQKNLLQVNDWHGISLITAIINGKKTEPFMAASFLIWHCAPVFPPSPSLEAAGSSDGASVCAVSQFVMKIGFQQMDSEEM